MNDELKQDTFQNETQEEVKNQVKETPQIDYIKLIKDRFTQYLHSNVVLTRAVKSCPIPQINQYLTKRLEQEPKWQNRWNIVYGIITDTELPKCKFCGKQLTFSAIAEKKIYCSEECKQADTNLKETSITNTQKKPNFFKSLFRLIFRLNK